MQAATEREIPESIRNGFFPTGPSVTIGWHDLFEDAEHEDGHLFGRAFFSFDLFGYSSPHDWAEYKKRIWKVPQVQKLQADLEDIIGQPLERCIYWSV
ncbi:MAG: hypothetical protein ACR2GY_06615 [Phycisphaerales bacterium]